MTACLHPATSAYECWSRVGLHRACAWSFAAVVNGCRARPRGAASCAKAASSGASSAATSCTFVQRKAARRICSAPACRLACTTSAPSSVGNAAGDSAGPTTNTTAPTAAVASLALSSRTAGEDSLPWKVQWQLNGASPAPANTDSSLVSFSVGGDMPPAPAPQFTWTPFDRAASVREAALEASGWDPATFEARYTDLVAVLPDLPTVLPSMSPAQLLAAMADPGTMAIKVVSLKAALPSTNVGMLLLMHPPFLDASVRVEQLLTGVEHARRVLGGRAVAEEVLQWYPPLMDPEVLDASVAQLRRLVPHLARQCLPSQRRAGDGAVQGYGAGASKAQGPVGGVAGADGSRGDARQLVHLLGIVMKSEGSGGDSGGEIWWGCS